MFRAIEKSFKKIESEYKKEEFSPALEDILNIYYPVPKPRKQSSRTLEVWKKYIESEHPIQDDLRADLATAQKLLMMFYPNKDSMHVKSIEWRKPIKSSYSYDEYRDAIIILGLTREESLKRKEDYKKKIRERSKKRDVERFKESQIYDVIDKCRTSEDIFRNIIAVMLACGARIIEIIKVSSFIEADDEDHVLVRGIAKNKSGIEVVRPLIRIKYPEFIDLIMRIRDYRDFASMSNAEATLKVDMEVNRELAKILKVTSHKLRYIYASLSHQIFAPDEPEQEYIRRMFGHSSSEVSLVYTFYKVRMDASKK